MCLEWTEIFKNGYPDVCTSHIFILVSSHFCCILYCTNHPFLSPCFFFSLVSRSFCSLYENNFPYILPHHNFHFLYNCSLAIFLRKPFLPTKAFLNLVDSSLMIPPHPVLMLDLPPCIVTSSLLGSNLLNPKLL